MEFLKTALFYNCFLQLVVQNWYLEVNFQLYFCFKIELVQLGKFWLSLHRSVFVIGKMHSVFQNHSYMLNSISWKSVEQKKWLKTLDKSFYTISLFVFLLVLLLSLQLAAYLVLPLGNAVSAPICIYIVSIPFSAFNLFSYILLQLEKHWWNNYHLQRVAVVRGYCLL